MDFIAYNTWFNFFAYRLENYIMGSFVIFTCRLTLRWSNREGLKQLIVSVINISF
jgi:dolichyl-phosphate-mannose--protein O-mannosyl transferase